jgi:hypothetical protein
LRINHLPLGGSYGTTSLLKSGGGEINGRLCPSLPLVVTLADICCVYVIGSHMGIGRVVTRCMFIDIVSVLVGKAYGFDQYQYEGTTIRSCSNPCVVLKCLSTFGSIIDKLIKLIIIGA